MKKFLSFLILFLFFSILFSNTYLPKYYLDDFKPVKDNEVDLYGKYLKNISLFKDNFYFSKLININKKVSADYDTGLIEIKYTINNKYEPIPPVYLTSSEYLSASFKGYFRQELKKVFKEYLKQKNRDTGSGLLKEIVLKIPKYAMPKAVSKFFGGDEAARLKLSGNQQITFSGTSTKTKNKSYNEGLANKNFSLKMQQNLNLNLHGTIGKKIIVNVKHRSDSNTQQNDEVDIHYEGLEDEIVKEVKAGDLNVSYSGLGNSFSSQGLFGVKADFQIGNLKLNTFIAKSKSKKNTKETNADSSPARNTIESKNFAKNYFYIDNPYDLYQIYDSSNAPPNLPEWANNAFVFNEYGQWIIKNPGLLPAQNTVIHVFVDDDNANNDQLTVRGKNWNEPADTTTYHFDELTKDVDFTYDENTGLIILTNAVQKQYTIGIVYTRADGIQVGSTEYDENDPQSFIQVKLIKKKNQDADTNTWIYQCRNIYDLGAQGISPEGFELKVFNYNSNNTENYYYHGNINYVDFLHLDTNGDGKVNGDETTIDLITGKLFIPMIYPFYALGDSVIYQKSNLTSDDETKMFISFEGKTQSDEIDLGTFNLVKNSVVVYLNNVKLKPNIDYIVDYDMGVITLLNKEAMNSKDKIKIEYEEIPLFSLENKTLFAAKASIGNKTKDNYYMNALWGYQSEKVKEERPKIGGENRSIFLAGVESGYKLEMPFMTKLVDKLPFINTDKNTNLDLNAIFNISLPHIYGSKKQPNKEEAYLEDMESSLELMGLGVTRRLWVPASKPYQLDFHKADVNWFVLSTWRAMDVYDNLSEEEKKEKIPVMTLKIIPDSLNQGEYWGGLMKYLGNQVDLSNKEYIELMIRPEDVSGDVNIHIDMGTLSEDFYTKYGGEGVLNTEDGKNGGAKNGTLDVGEDIGLDGIKNSEEEGYDSDTNKDPHHDNFNNKKINNEYPYINRTENNSVLDTEDLNSNGRLDVKNVYFEYTFPLSDISEWYVNDTHTGFKYFRIPLKDFTQIISSNGEQPELDKIEYVRLWFDVAGKSKFNIAFFNLVGNRWKKMALRDEETGEILTGHDLNPDEEIRLGTADTQKDIHYVQPKQTKIRTEKETLEQSIFLEADNLETNHLALISEKLSADNSNSSLNNFKGVNLLDYKKLRFLVYAEDAENSIQQKNSEYLHLYFRICYDSLNYYEIRYDSLLVNPYDADIQDGIPKMKRSNWKQFEIDFSDLSNLKSSLMYGNGDSIIVSGKYKLRIVHQKNQWPTLTNVKMLMFGIAPGNEQFNGKVYFDDIRVAYPVQNTGYNFRTSLAFNLAGLSKVTLTYETKNPDFLNSVSRDAKPSNKQHEAFTIRNDWYFGKFFPAEWGINLPLSITKTKNFDKNIYKEDILTSQLPEKERKNQTETRDNFALSLDYSLNKTPRSKILEYTFKKSKIYLDYSKDVTFAPLTRDTTRTFSAKYIYDLDIPEDKVDIKLWKNYRFYFFPTKFTNTYTYNDIYKRVWKYNTSTEFEGWKIDTNSYPTTTLDTKNGINYKIFSDLSCNYSLNTSRDLKLENYYKGIPIGVEKSRDQSISARFDPKYTDKIFSFSISPSANYSETHRKTGLVDTLYYSGNVSRNTNVNIVLKNSDLISSFGNWLNSKFSAKKKEESDNKKDKKSEKKEIEKKENKFEENKFKYDNYNSDNYSKKTEINKEENSSDYKSDTDKNQKNNNWEKDKNYKNRKNYNKNVIKSNNIFVKFISYFSRISNININYTNSYSSNYDREAKRPPFLYQLGLPHTLADSLLLSKKYIDRYSLSGSVAILDGLNTNWQYDKEKTKTWGQTQNYTDTTTFPNISLSFSQIGKLLRIQDILESSTLSSSYLYSIEKAGILNNPKPDRITERFNLNPLLAWDANWKYGIHSSIKTFYQFEINTTNNAANTIVKYSYNKKLDINVNWSFSAPSGIDFPILKRIHFKNELKPSMTITINEEKSYLKSDKKHPEKWNLNYLIVPKADYEFNKAITGSLSLQYSLKKNLKDNSSIRDFKLEISVSIRF